VRLEKKEEEFRYTNFTQPTEGSTVPPKASKTLPQQNDQIGTGKVRISPKPSACLTSKA
jgi:hypothetical protein